MTALADEPVHVVATLPAGLPPASADVKRDVARVCRMAWRWTGRGAVTHGGMGATQKALDHGVPVCVVPFGRDRYEVARRVEVARGGTACRRRS